MCRLRLEGVWTCQLMEDDIRLTEKGRFRRFDCLSPDDVDGKETSLRPESGIVRSGSLIPTCGVARGELGCSDLMRVVVVHCRGEHWRSVRQSYSVMATDISSCRKRRRAPVGW